MSIFITGTQATRQPGKPHVHHRVHLFTEHRGKEIQQGVLEIL